MIRTAILGASGYVGGELLRLLDAHPVLMPVKLFGESKAGLPLGQVHPHLAPAYPAAILALKPLVDAGLVKPDSLIVDAASGVSGAGRELRESTSFNTVDGSFSAYGLLNHRHTAEMEMALGGTVLFTPHLAPMTRGILATCYADATDQTDPLDLLRAAYADEPFVHVTAEPPATKWLAGSNGAQVTARYDARTNRVLALAAIDNLGKGAAGQMIQCANLMLGVEETAGLTSAGGYP